MNHEGRIFWKTKRKVFNETRFVALKSSSIPLVSDKKARFCFILLAMIHGSEVGIYRGLSLGSSG